jgi:hypothetical protein
VLVVAYLVVQPLVLFVNRFQLVALRSLGCFLALIAAVLLGFL